MSTTYGVAMGQQYEAFMMARSNMQWWLKMLFATAFVVSVSACERSAEDSPTPTMSDEDIVIALEEFEAVIAAATTDQEEVDAIRALVNWERQCNTDTAMGDSLGCITRVIDLDTGRAVELEYVRRGVSIYVIRFVPRSDASITAALLD
jgi:hypothetical protein